MGERWDQFLTNLGTQSAPFGFAAGVDPRTAGANVLGNIGAGMLANVTKNPLEAFGASYQQEMAEARANSRDALSAKVMFDQMEEKKRERAKEQVLETQFNQYVSGLPPDQQALARFGKSDWIKAQIDDQFKDQKLPDPMSVAKGSVIYDPVSKTWITPPVGAGGATQAIDDPLKISKNFEGSPGMSRIAQIAPTIKSMSKSLSDPSAMADLDFVYGLAKILDPTSVVRESEGKMVIDAQGIGPQLLGQLNKFMSGEQAMLPEIRRRLFGVAYRRAKELEDQANQERGHFSGVAMENQFDPETYLQQVPKLPVWQDQNLQPPAWQDQSHAASIPKPISGILKQKYGLE